DCMNGSMDWHVDGEHGRMQLARITGVMGLGCPVGNPVPEQPESRFSGSWYDPSHAGEGYVLEVLSNGALLVYWFTFDPDGNRRWFLGVGEVVNGDLVFPDMLTTRGPSFGEAYDPALFETLPWGSLTLDIGCGGGPAVYDATEEGFGSGQLDVVRLTTLAGLDCP
ncbi:MAG: hypothetical protein R3233_08890, partial [Xanthomonadales bacterium]|nr:hypothetical protein [Xanthomonadales bacterium]